MPSYLIKNAQVVNEGQIRSLDVLIANGIIQRIGTQLQTPALVREIDAEGLFLIPGIIDDQVHFREPGLTHKAEIYTEAKAAVAGGVTSFMEMPNVKPPTLSHALLEEKYQIAAERSLANYSFFMGTSNDNIEEVLRTDMTAVCGLKIFMGSSTGNMLVDNEKTLETIFSQVPTLIATHCEDEATVRHQTAAQQAIYGDDIPVHLHPIIRDVEACYLSSSMAVALAKKHNTRLHILHISTAKELALFDNSLPLRDKRITSEVCVHHLYFNADDYARYGTQIKCNPAVKDEANRAALLPALLDGRIDIVATDHAPHTWAEKQGNYMQAPSGVPLVQHSLNVMLSLHQRGEISLEAIVDKMCHAPAECFRLRQRGYIREGYAADLVLLDAAAEWTVQRENLYYKCGWSPFEGQRFKGRVLQTFVNGHLAYDRGRFDESRKGQRLLFEAER